MPPVLSFPVLTVNPATGDVLPLHVNGLPLNLPTGSLCGSVPIGTGGGGSVLSVNGHTGAVSLTASDVGAQPVDSDLTAIAALSTTSFGRGFLPLADAATARTYIGVSQSNLAQQTDAYQFLSGLADRTVMLARFVFTGGPLNGTIGYSPGVTYSGSLYVRDFAITARGRPELFTPSELFGFINIFASLQGGSGQIYDGVALDGTLITGPNGVASIDNSFEFVDLCYSHYQKTGLPTAYTTYHTVITAALAYPTITNHLVNIADAGNSTKIGWGFQDDIVSTGYEAMTSMMRFRALNQLSEMATAAGETSNATAYSTEAALIPASLETQLYDGTVHLFHNASTQNTQHSVMASAFAVVQNCVSSTVKAQICAKLLAGLPGNADDLAGKGFVQNGQISHLPLNETWSVVRGSHPAGTYQEGGYWAVGTGWVYQAVALVDLGQANTLLQSYVSYCRAQPFATSPPEASNSLIPYLGSPNYVVSACLPLEIFKGLGLVSYRTNQIETARTSGQPSFGPGGYKYTDTAVMAGWNVFNNGTTDTPGIKVITGDYHNFAFNSSAGRWRIGADIGESTGASLVTGDASGNIFPAGSIHFLQQKGLIGPLGSGMITPDDGVVGAQVYADTGGGVRFGAGSLEFGRFDLGGEFLIGLTTPDTHTKMRVYESGSSGSDTWRGRGVFGGAIKAVVLGEINSLAVLGGHASALNAWADLYVQPGTSGTYVHLGASGGSQVKLDDVGASKLLSTDGSNIVIGTTPGTGVLTFLATPTGANLAAALTTALPVSKGGTAGTSIITAWDSINTKGADIASATTTDLSTATGPFVNVTGTTTITGLGTAAAGTRRMVRFTGIGTLAHNGTSLILLGGASITRTNGDVAVFESLGSGNWRCLQYQKVDGTALKGGVVLGQQIFDLSNLISFDGGNRELFADDSTTVAMDWTDPTQVNIGNGSIIAHSNDFAEFPNGFSANAFSDGHGGAVGTYIGPTEGWRTMSSDNNTFFDNLGFYGNGSLITGVAASTVTGVTDGSDAAAGKVGERISASIVQASAVSLTTATPKTVTSISLTAGDWDVTAIGAITGASTGTVFDVAIGGTTNSLTGTVLGDTRCQTPTVSLTGADATLMVPAARISISSTTTYYLIVQETFTIGSPKAYGRISARRVR